MSFEVFSYESLVHAVSGAMGSVTAMTVFFPLDTARLRLQVDESRESKSTPAILAEIIKEEGLLAPYRGWFPVICSLCCSNFVYFYCFHTLKTGYLKGQQSTSSADLLIGMAAGIVNVLVTTPLWVVNTRLKLQGSKFRNAEIRSTNYSGILDAFMQIIRDEGVGALWNGTFPSLLLVLNPAIQFMIYEGLKRQLRKGAPRELTSIEVFIIGAVAKAVATTLTYPLQTIQSVLRGYLSTNLISNLAWWHHLFVSMATDDYNAILWNIPDKFGQFNESTEKSKLLLSLQTIKCLLINRTRRYGVLGLFKGLEAKLLQTVLTAALMFLLYEKIASCTFRAMGLQNTHRRR